MQSFPNIIEEGYAYVDKTYFIKPLIMQGRFVFLSRPRRFGKSLLLSTLKSYFEGRRELFKGLAADEMDLDWTPSPVLRFDLNAEDFSMDKGLASLLNRLLSEFEKEYGMTQVTDTLAGRFSQLIRRALNREVEISFYKLLLTVYDPRANQQGGPFDFAQFKKDLAKGDIHSFMRRLQAMLKDLPGCDHN